MVGKELTVVVSVLWTECLFSQNSYVGPNAQGDGILRFM